MGLASPLRISTSLALFAALLIAGCAAPCKRVRSAHADFTSRSAPAETPDLALSVPLSSLEELAHRELSGLDSTRMTLPKVAGMSMGNVEARVERMKLRPAGKGKIGVTFVLGIRSGKKQVMTAEFDAALRAKVDTKRRRVDLVLSGKDIQSMRPKLGKNARKQLGDFLYGKLPSSIRPFTSRKQVGAIATKLAERLLKQSFDHFRKSQSSKLGEVSRLSFDLPALPIRKVELESTKAGFLELAMYTDLPASAGLTGPPGRVEGVHAKAVQLRVSGSAAAEFANRAMKEGQIPERWDLNGKPSKDGPLLASVGWEAGDRPLKIHLWQLEDDCAHVTMGATPRVAVDERKITLSTRDAKVEDVEGSFKVRAGIWFSGLGRRSFTHVEKIANRMTFDVGGRTMRGKIRKALVNGDELVVTMQLSSK
jgi:hypothetical protein